jgi:bifunctional non-homologous end joining protein LigD
VPVRESPQQQEEPGGEGITAEDMAAIVWLTPSVVAEVAFTEWTNDSNLRHAAFVGLRDDEPSEAVRREP